MCYKWIQLVQYNGQKAYKTEPASMNKNSLLQITEELQEKTRHLLSSLPWQAFSPGFWYPSYRALSFTQLGPNQVKRERPIRWVPKPGERKYLETFISTQWVRGIQIFFLIQEFVFKTNICTYKCGPAISYDLLGQLQILI